MCAPCFRAQQKADKAKLRQGGKPQAHVAQVQPGTPAADSVTLASLSPEVRELIAFQKRQQQQARAAPLSSYPYAQGFTS